MNLPLLLFLVSFLMRCGDTLSQETTTPDKFSKDYSSCDKTNSVLTSLKKNLDNFYENLKKEKKVYYWELVDRNIRLPHYCIDECMCIHQSFIKKLNEVKSTPSSVSHDLDYMSIKIFGGTGLLPVKVKGNGRTGPSYAYHVATLIHYEYDDCYLVVDPVIYKSVELLSPQEWIDQFESLDDNKLLIQRTGK